MKTASQGAGDSELARSRPAGLPPGTVSWVAIDRAALRANVAAFRGRLARGVRLVAVVKSDAYGHGAAICAPEALAAGADWLAVGGIGEAIGLRSVVGPQPPILALNHIPRTDLAAAVEHDIRVTLYDPESLESLADAARRTGRPARLHLKLETGTHRQGLPAEELVNLARRINATPGLELDGLSSHFADVEDTTDHRFAELQHGTFERCYQQLVDLGLRPAHRHIACSAATILLPETHGDLARAGIGIYGLWSSRETLVSARERGLEAFSLTPVMSWHCLIAQVKDVPVGGFVGYGRTWRASRSSRIAILPIGYYEGYARSLSGRAHVLIDGRRAPVIGRICMNMTMVDVTDIPRVTGGDIATLIGRSGDEELRVEDLAAWAGTIHYEMVSRIHPTLPRIPRPCPPVTSP